LRLHLVNIYIAKLCNNYIRFNEEKDGQSQVTDLRYVQQTQCPTLAKNSKVS